MEILLIIFFLSAFFAVFFAGKAYWCFKTGDIWNVSFGICAFVAFAIAFALTPESHKDLGELRGSDASNYDVEFYGNALSHYLKQNNGSFPPKEGWRDALIGALVQADKDIWNDPTKDPRNFIENPSIDRLKNSRRNIAFNANLAGKKFSDIDPEGLIGFADSNVRGGRSPVFRSASELVISQSGINGHILKPGKSLHRGPWISLGRIVPSKSSQELYFRTYRPEPQIHPLIQLLGKGIHYLGLILGVLFFGLGASGLVMGNEKVPLGGLYLSGFVLLLLITLCLPYYRGNPSVFKDRFPSSMTRLP